MLKFERKLFANLSSAARPLWRSVVLNTLFPPSVHFGLLAKLELLFTILRFRLFWLVCPETRARRRISPISQFYFLLPVIPVFQGYLNGQLEANDGRKIYTPPYKVVTIAFRVKQTLHSLSSNSSETVNRIDIQPSPIAVIV